MKRIYEAANNVEAHMIVHLLDASGIEAHVQGEHLQSGAGELPLGGLAAVAVADEDAEAARRIVKEWEARTRSTPEAKSTQISQRKFPGQLIAFAVGGLIAGSAVWTLHHGPDSANGVDWNNDGKNDGTDYYDGGRLERVELDRNFDGKIDAIDRYDLKGWIQRVEADDDFDGRMEATTTYRNAQPVEQRIDHADGRAELRTSFRSGVIEMQTYFNSAGVAVKRVHYRNAKPDIAELDLDADGKWERTYRFDRYDEPTDIKSTN